MKTIALSVAVFVVGAIVAIPVAVAVVRSLRMTLGPLFAL